MPTTRRPEAVALYAAGSLSAALGEVARDFSRSTGIAVESRFGPSGALRDEILAGATADVFASANVEHPQALRAAGRAGAVHVFARNTICALVRPGLPLSGETLLDAMLDPNLRLGTSTPKADPSGDYAFEVFSKVERLRTEAGPRLETKALLLTGGPDSASAPAGCNLYGWHVAEGRADIFLTYRTNALAAQEQNPRLGIVDLPGTLAVGASYGLTIIEPAKAAAQRLVELILSPNGRNVLQHHGFALPG
jgi:ABC-type molybdate transport system substrate-binding protein